MVGVVGAARVPGIRRMWAQAGAPDFKREVQEYLTVPYTARSSTAVLIPVVTTGAAPHWRSADLQLAGFMRHALVNVTTQ